jgi:hypothetical protein
MENFLTELKMARENAILGNYEVSLQKYKAVISMVRSHLQTQMGDMGTKQKWKVVSDQITREMQIAGETNEIKASFSKENFGGQTGAQRQRAPMIGTESMEV